MRVGCYNQGMKADFTPPTRHSKVCEFVRGLMIGVERFGNRGDERQSRVVVLSPRQGAL